MTNAENFRQNKMRFYLIVEQTFAFDSSTNLSEKLKMCTQISNELHDGALCYG